MIRRIISLVLSWQPTWNLNNFQVTMSTRSSVKSQVLTPIISPVHNPIISQVVLVHTFSSKSTLKRSNSLPSLSDAASSENVHIAKGSMIQLIVLKKKDMLQLSETWSYNNTIHVYLEFKIRKVTHGFETKLCFLIKSTCLTFYARHFICLSLHIMLSTVYA